MALAINLAVISKSGEKSVRSISELMCGGDLIYTPSYKYILILGALELSNYRHGSGAFFFIKSSYYSAIIGAILQYVPVISKLHKYCLPFPKGTFLDNPEY